MAIVTYHTTYIVRKKHEKSEGNCEVSLDTPFLYKAMLKVEENYGSPLGSTS